MYCNLLQSSWKDNIFIILIYGITMKIHNFIKDSYGMERNEQEARKQYDKVTESRVAESADNGLQPPEPEKKERKKRKTKEKEVEA